jgi:hypothetical protein
MIDLPAVVLVQTQPLALLHLTIPRADISQVMGPGLREVLAAIAAQGLRPAGPWLTHHLRFPPGRFDFELGVPVDAPFVAAGRVSPGERPAARVARTVLRGGYEGLGAAWQALDAWVRAQGHTPAEDLWEVYSKGPETGAEGANWETELFRPLKTP